MNKDGNYVSILSMLFVELGVFSEVSRCKCFWFDFNASVLEEIHTSLIGPTKAYNLFIYIHTKSK